MQTIRISATDLDAYRYYRGDEDADLGALLAQLRRETAPTEAMEAGTAFHAALERAEPGQYGELSANGYTFTLACDANLDLPAIREVKSTGLFLVDGIGVTLVGKVDAVHGKRVDDHKLTARFDAERYLSSYQWRAYLDLFGADEFRWNVFEGREDEPKHYTIEAVHPLTMYRYPALHDDLMREVGLFVEFARAHLPERFETVP